MPTPEIEQKLREVAKSVSALRPCEHPGLLESPATDDDWAVLFERRFNDLRAPGDLEPGVIHVADAREAAATVARLCEGLPPDEIISTGGEFGVESIAGFPSAAAQFALRAHPEISVAPANSRCDSELPGRPPKAPRDFAVGVTRAFALIAATGSVVVEIARSVDAWPSLLVARHIVVASRDQIVPDLPAFYRRLGGSLALPQQLGSPPRRVALPQQLSAPARRDGLPQPAPCLPAGTTSPRCPIHVCITGCSRTADIEKLLVVPAHGPRQVRVILCRASG